MPTLLVGFPEVRRYADAELAIAGSLCGLGDHHGRGGNGGRVGLRVGRVTVTKGAVVRCGRSVPFTPYHNHYIFHWTGLLNLGGAQPLHAMCVLHIIICKPI